MSISVIWHKYRWFIGAAVMFLIVAWGVSSCLNVKKLKERAAYQEGRASIAEKQANDSAQAYGELRAKVDRENTERDKTIAAAQANAAKAGQVAATAEAARKAAEAKVSAAANMFKENIALKEVVAAFRLENQALRDQLGEGDKQIFALTERDNSEHGLRLDAEKVGADYKKLADDRTAIIVTKDKIISRLEWQSKLKGWGAGTLAVAAVAVAVFKK